MKRPRPDSWYIYGLWLLLLAAILALSTPTTTGKYVWEKPVGTFQILYGE